MKLTKFIVLAAAVVAAAACLKNETVSDVVAVDSREIGFEAVSYVPTKAGELSGTVLPKEYGIYAAATQRAESRSIENPSFFPDPYEQLFGTTDNPATASSLWRCGTFSSSFTAEPVYWPLGGARMDFLAYAIPMSSHETTGLSTGVWSATWDNGSTDAASSVTFNDVDTYSHQQDVLFAAANDQTSSANGGFDELSQPKSVHMNFEHAQALLIFNVKVNSEGAGQVAVNEIAFVNEERVNAVRSYQTAMTVYTPTHTAWEAKKAAEYDILVDAAEKEAWMAANPEPVAPTLPDLTDAQVTLKTVGTFSVDNSRIVLISGWSFGSDACRAGSYRIPDAGAESPANSYVDSTSDTDELVDFGDAISNTSYWQLGESLLIPEQDKVNFVLRYTINGKMMQYVFNDLKGVWQKGHKYFYNLDLTVNELVITESVADFDVVYTPAPSVTFTSVPTGEFIVGNTFQLKYDLVSGSGVVFSSTDSGVATVNASGLVTAVSAGTTTIKVAIDGNESVSDSFVLTVLPVPNVTITNKPASSKYVGNSYTLTYTATGPVTFTSTNTDAVTVNSFGVLSMVGTGTSKIRAALTADPGVYDEFNLTVLAPYVTIGSKPYGPMYVNGTHSLSCSSSGAVTWTSSDSYVADVSSSGVITAYATGSTTIRAALNTDLSVYDEFVLTVSSAPPAPTVLSGAFSVSDYKQVSFSTGLLRATVGSASDAYNYDVLSWECADNQYDIIGDAGGNASFSYGSSVDLYGWVGGSAYYDSFGMSTNTTADNEYYGTLDFESLKTPWGNIPQVVSQLGYGWEILSSNEWQYLLQERSDAVNKQGLGIVNGVKGLILLPDYWVQPWNCSFFPSTGDWDNVYTLDYTGESNAWCDMEAAGAVFLPVAGTRSGTTVSGLTSGSEVGYYWTSDCSGSDAGTAICLSFQYGDVSYSSEVSRSNGCAIRLVRDSNM